MAKKSHIKVRMVPEKTLMANSCMQKNQQKVKAKNKLKLKKYNPNAENMIFRRKIILQ